MSKSGRRITGILVITSVLALAGPVGGASAKFAGTVRTLDSAKGSLVLEDVGPWIGKVETPITPRMITLSPATEYFVADRAKDGPAGFPGEYKEVRAQLSDVKPGAFIFVECQPAGGRCTASKLTVVRPSQP
jgi:hypothetical protein